MVTPDSNWVLFTKRTNDPKLAYIERRLDALDIPHRRHGDSFHAPILQVPADRHGQAYALLNERIDVARGQRPYTRRLDDLADDHPLFRGV